MLNQKEIEKAICKINCGNENGSGFLISENLILTARHNILDYSKENNITIEFPNINENGIQLNAIPLNIELSIESDLDAVILKLENPIHCNHFDLEDSLLPYNTEWKSFGYYKKNVSSILIGADIEGTISRTIEQEKLFNWDIQVRMGREVCDISGLSGAPLLVDGKACGVIIVQNDDTIGAVSINKISKILNEVEIEYLSRSNEEDIPEAIRHNVKNSIPNYNMFNEIDRIIDDGITNYNVISGTQGSGKTTLIASYNSLNDKVDVCGRYIIKIPNDKYSLAYRCNETNFAKWLLNTISKQITNHVADSKVLEYTEYIEVIADAFVRIGKHLEQRDKIGVFFIDGLDELTKHGDAHKFLSLLPPSLPNNIFLFFSSNSMKLYTRTIPHLMDKNCQIIIKPLDQYDCEVYILNKMYKHKLNHSQIINIYTLSEGNPLYLNYIIDYFANNLQVDDFNTLINKIPSFGGDIHNYYESIWADIKDSPDKIWILATIARLRGNLWTKEFIVTLPSESQHSFNTYYSEIKHLLLDNDTITISHSSLSDFIGDKTKNDNEIIHKNISNYCLSNLEDLYSIKNSLYHLSNSTIELKDKAIKLCNQEWVDRCAMSYIEPDIILDDVQNILSLSIIRKRVQDVIRILLLLQRLNFRYNNIFAENAALLAKAHIEMGEESKAIDFIIRQGSLIVSDEDSLYILNQLYRVGAITEAQVLYNVIRDRIIYRYEVAIEENQGFPIALLEYEMMVNTINANNNSKKSKESYFNNMKRLSELLSNSSGDETDIGNYIMGRSSAYSILSRGEYLRVKDFIKKRDLNKPKDYTVFLSIIVGMYDSHRIKYKDQKHNDIINTVSEDIEYMYVKYNTNDLILTVDALIKTSNNYTLIQKMISQIPEVILEVNIRDKNGVDVNWSNVKLVLNKKKYEGYVENNKLELLDLNKDNWEDWIGAYLQLLGLFKGRLYRARAISEDFSNLNQDLDLLITQLLNIKLSDRINWKRSYHLPEDLFHFIYSEITEFLLLINPSELPNFINKIIDNGNNQLGLYSEGFIDVIIAVSNTLLIYDIYSKSIFKLLKHLENHIEAFVLNRWERSQYYLQLIELYGRIGSVEKTKCTYKKMLATSMGPSWYKEDQFSLLDTCIRNLNMDSRDKVGFIHTISSLLDLADGEVTFQRYVRAEKHDLIGNLCSCGYLNGAVQYLKKETFPSVDILFDNIEKKSCDSSSDGMGYVNGCNELIVQDAILSILENTTDIDPIIKWAFTEIFIIGDERYLDRYISIQCSILNDEKINSSSHYSNIEKRVIRQIISEFDFNIQKKYIFGLKNYLTHDMFESIVLLLEQNNFNVNDILNDKSSDSESIAKNTQKERKVKEAKVESSDLYLPGVFGKKEGLLKLSESIHKAKEELDFENKEKSTKLLIDGVKSVQNSDWNIWSGNVSNEVREAIKLLISICKSDSEYIYAIKDLIDQETFSHSWVIADKLIKDIGGMINSENAKLIFESVINHFEIMLDFPQLESHTYLTVDSDCKNSMILSELLVWFLQYPDQNIKEKTIEILSWLSKVESDKIVPMLIEICCDGSMNSKELVAGILHGLALDNSLLVWEYIKDNDDYMDKISSIDHFMVRYSFIKIMNLVRGKCQIKDQFKKKLLDNFESNGEKDFECLEECSEPNWFKRNRIQYILKSLDEDDVINEGFKINLIKELKEICEPRKIEDVIKADKYITRSFNNSEGLYSLFFSYFQYSINKVSNNYATRYDYDDFAKILISYNPYFSNNKLNAKKNNIAYGFINTFSRAKIEDEFTSYENQVLLYCQVLLENEEKTRFNHYELEAVILHDYKPIEEYISIVSSDRFTIKDGGPFVSIKLTGESYSLFSISDSNLIINNWRYGRNCHEYRFGMPLESGQSVYIEKKYLSKIQEPFRLVWIIRDHNMRRVKLYDFNNNRFLK